ncbi:MAG: MGMT family protein [Candidatus Methylacidiphilales bacterium]
MDKYTFFQNVFDVVRQIPYGKATSYGAIAKYLGSAKSGRMVGYAMNASHQIIPPIPAHRLVNRNGLLTGKHHFGGNTMQELLEAEGFIIENNQIQNFDKHFWDPNVELAL